MAHALLSPSSAERWLTCTPSARLEATFPDSTNAAAEEGTLAHKLGEALIYEKLSIAGGFAEVEEEAIVLNPLYDAAMQEHCESYADFVIEQFNEAKKHTKDARLFLEQNLNLTDYVPEGFGTSDVVIIADRVMHVIDLKYGKGVPVSCENNKQMKLYALGALREFDFLYDIQTVRMTIYQPRLDNISTSEISVDELRQWAEDELKPLADLAWNGAGEFIAGKHCRFCKAKAVCKANAAMNMDLAKYDFEDPSLLTDKEVSDILDRADTFKNWIKSVEEHALTEAVNNGKRWPGYKVVIGRSNRVYSDEDLVATKLLKQGYTQEQIYKIKLAGITEMEKLVGKKNFETLLSDLIIKPPGAPTLAPATDKRPEVNSLQTAIEDFS